MLLVNESSWDKVVFSTDFVDVLFEEHHVVEVVLDKTLPLELVGIVVLVNVIFKCSLDNLRIKIFPP